MSLNHHQRQGCRIIRWVISSATWESRHEELCALERRSLSNRTFIYVWIVAPSSPRSPLARPLGSRAFRSDAAETVHREIRWRAGWGPASQLWAPPQAAPPLRTHWPRQLEENHLYSHRFQNRAVKTSLCSWWAFRDIKMLRLSQQLFKLRQMLLLTFI